MSLTPSHAVVVAHIADADSPNDPNLATLAELAAVMNVDSSVVSTVTSQVVSAAASGALDSAPVSTADSKAASSGTRASTADSKALSVSVNTSVADSKTVSGSSNTSIADSKAVSVAGATVVTEIPNYPIVAGETGVVDRTWGYGNVRRYGALGANADNTAAFQSAHDSISAIGGGSVTYPYPVGGYYRLDGTLAWGRNVSHIAEGGFSVDGSAVGRGIQIKRPSGTQTMVEITGSPSSPFASYQQPILVRGLTFHGNETAGTIMDIRYAQLLVFEHVQWIYCAERALRLRAVGDSRFNNCLWENSGSTTGALAALAMEDDATASFACNQIRFVNCRWEQNAYGHVSIEGRTGALAFDISFPGAKFESAVAQTYPIRIKDAQNIVFDEGWDLIVNAAAPSAPEMGFYLEHVNPIMLRDGVGQFLKAGTLDFIQVANSTMVSVGDVFHTGTVSRSVVNLLDTASRLIPSGYFGPGLGSAAPTQLILTSANGQLTQVLTPLLRISGAPSAVDATSTVWLPCFFNSGDLKLWVFVAGSWRQSAAFT